MCVCEYDNVFWQNLFSYWKKRKEKKAASTSSCLYYFVLWQLELRVILSHMVLRKSWHSLSLGQIESLTHQQNQSQWPEYNILIGCWFWGECRGSPGEKKNQGTATKSRVNEHRIGKNNTKICDQIRNFRKKSLCFTAGINTTF